MNKKLILYKKIFYTIETITNNMPTAQLKKKQTII